MTFIIKNAHSRFTLVEMLIVIAVISILIAVLMPALNSARYSADSAVCQNNLRQYGIVEAQYRQIFRGFFPTAWNSVTTLNWKDYLTLAGLVLPTSTTLPITGINRCPAEANVVTLGNTTHYTQNRFSKVWNIWLRESQVKKPSQTVMLTDACVVPNWVAYDYHDSLTNSANLYANRHNRNQARNFCLVDGHTQSADIISVYSGLFIWGIVNSVTGEPVENR